MKPQIYAICVAAVLFAACDKINGNPDGPSDGTGTEQPETPSGKKIKQIIYEEENNANLYTDLGYSADYDNCTMTFSYDEKGRVGSVEIEYPKHDREDDLKSIGWTADYSTVGEISLKERYSFPDRNGEAQHHVGLDSKGNAKTFGYYYDTDYENNYEMCFEFGYTAENYLSEVDDKEVGYKENFYYENGCLAKYRASHKESSETLSFDAGKYFPNRCPNNSQIDGFGFLVQFGDGLPSNILRYFGLVGHTEKYMMECFPYGGSGFSDSPRPMSYPEPNKVIHTSYTTGKFADDNPEAEVNYKYDEDNCITDIVSTLSFSVIQVDYDIVVGNELLYPEMPEGGYKYEVKNRTEKKVKDDSITKTWKIIY